MTPPACTCEQPTKTGHDERCPYLKYVRSGDYEPDLALPEFLDRRTKSVASATD